MSVVAQFEPQAWKKIMFTNTKTFCDIPVSRCPTQQHCCCCVVRQRMAVRTERGGGRCPPQTWSCRGRIAGSFVYQLFRRVTPSSPPAGTGAEARHRPVIRLPIHSLRAVSFVGGGKNVLSSIIVHYPPMDDGDDVDVAPPSPPAPPTFPSLRSTIFHRTVSPARSGVTV